MLLKCGVLCLDLICLLLELVEVFLDSGFVFF